MTNGMTQSGIGPVGDIPWGTHFCHFYQGKQDLLDVLVPFFKAGLEQHEFCVWAMFGPLDEKEAATALERALPGAHARLVAGDIEIVPQFQRRGDDPAPRQLVRAWAAKLDKALDKRLLGNEGKCKRNPIGGERPAGPGCIRSRVQRVNR